MQAVPNFVRPFFRASLLKVVAAFLLLVILGLAGPLPSQAAENYLPDKEFDPQLNQLHQELVKLQYQEVLIAGLKKLLVADVEAANEKDLPGLAKVKNNLTGDIAKLQLEIQHREKQATNYAVAEKVRAAPDPTDYKEDRYDRTGYSRATLSDCTWYTAEAVKLASAGRIDLNNRNSVFGNWGNGGAWAAKAQAFAASNPGGLISGVDKIPRPGDIVEWPDHVAFVEKVRPIQDEQGKLVRYSLVVSEEIATGVGRKDSTPVKPEDDQKGVIKRWRVNLELDVKDGPEIVANLRFIHFDY